MKLITTDEFRKELRAKRDPSGAVFRLSTTEPELLADEGRTLRFIFSDETIDRMGDKILASGWDLSDFKANPVALWAHDSSSPPIGKARNVGVTNSKLIGDIEFPTEATYDFGATIFRLLKGQFLRAVSVGFLPTKYAFVETSDRPWGIDFEEQQLLEISVCPIPANPNALTEARAKGIDTRPLALWAEKVLDGGDAERGKVLVTRTELQRLQKLAKEPRMATKPKPRRKAGEDDPSAGGELVLGNCGREKDDECGMKDPDECSVHAGSKSEDPDRIDPDDEKALLKALRKINPKYRDVDDASDDSDGPPMAHEDAIRLAHKSLRTSKSFMTDAVEWHGKAMDLLKPVVDALDEAHDDTDVGDGGQPKADDAGEKSEDEDDPDTKKALAKLAAAQKEYAAAIKKKHARD